MRKRTIKGWIACLLLAAFLLTGCGAGGENGAQEDGGAGEPSAGDASGAEPAAVTELTLAVDQADSLSPYELKTRINKSIVSLLYDPLYRLNLSYEPVGVLASGAVLSEGTCRVTLSSEIRFWDGSEVTADDVAYSFELARRSGAYASQLEGVLSCAAENEKTVVFGMKEDNSLFTNLLTFPIIKRSGVRAGIPIGSGRFLPDGENAYELVKNPSRQTGGMERVRLVAIPDQDSLASGIRIRLFDYMPLWALGNEEPAMGTSTKVVYGNSLVYLGVNQQREPLGNVSFRKALFLMGDRDKLSQEAFSGRARAAYTPFNPAVKWLPDAEFYDGGSKAQAGRFLEEAGLSKADAAAPWLMGGESVSLELLVNGDSAQKKAAAKELSDDFAAFGMELRIRELPYQDYLAAVRSGDYDLYLGEIRLSEDMDLTPLFLQMGTVSQELLERYAAFRKEIEAADGFIIQFSDDCPVIPLVYHDTAVLCARGFEANVVATEDDIFYNIDEW